MFRKSLGCWLLSLLLGPTCALALEIGEIQVSSSLNQLFDARIPLPKLTPEELNKVSVKLAPPSMYKEFGLDRASALGNLVFSIEYNAEGDVYVRAVSTQPIREPSLGLLLEFSWPRGKTFREFTVLLDPVQRLAKRPSDRTKTVLDASGGAATEPATAAVPPVQPQPTAAAPTAPAASAPTAAPVAAVSSPETVAAPVAPVAPPPAPTSAATAPVAVVPPPQTVIASAATMPTPPAPAPPDDIVSAGTSPAPVPPATTPATAPTTNTTAAASTAGVPMADSGPAQPPQAATSLPVEARPVPAKALKGGDSYGPVTAGEKLWKIAAKLRPDPDITPEQMMQALYKANPHAFAKSGIDGLKAGSTLRVPTLREIAKFSGSDAAKRLADTEDTALAMLAETAKPSADPVGAGSVERPEAKGPIAFPLAPPVDLEPIAMAMSPVKPDIGERARPPVAIGAASGVTETGPAVGAVAPSAGGAADRKIAAPSDASKAVLQAAKVPGPINPPALDAVAKPSIAARAVSPPPLEPIAATPLPFAAVSEVMASVTKIPAFALPAQIAPGAIIADVPSPTTQKIPAMGATPPIAITRQVVGAPSDANSEAIEAAATTGQLAEPPKASGHPSATAQNPSGPKPSTVPPLSADLLSAIEEPIRRMESASVDLTSYSARAAAEQTPPLMATPASEAGQELVPSRSATSDEKADDEHAEKAPAKAVSPPAAEVPPAAVSAPDVSSPAAEAPPATPIPPAGEATAVPPTDPVKASVEPRYKGGDQYGPTAPNERLWDIAAKVRPDPGIGKEVMMKALFMANRQAFARSGIERMKVGAMLRVPTLREIADYTGSPAAKQLLEQQAKSAVPSPSEPKASSESISRTEADPMPVTESGARSEPGSESELKPSPQPAQPVADTPALSATPSPSADPVKASVEPRYKGGDQYGPTAPNERLWDIAAKVRPDPGIGKEVMMKALFMANRQAFARSGIERMKVGAMLRVPTLREIADYTGSPAAKQLLEQQAKSAVPSPSEPKASSESISRTEADPMPVTESGARSEPGSESELKPSPRPAQPVADTPALSATPTAE